MATGVHPERYMLSGYLKALFRYAGLRAYVSVGLTVILGLAQGAGLLMLIPFLHLIGIGGGEAASGGLAASFGRLMRWMGFPLSMSSVLCMYLGIVAVHSSVTRYREILNVSIINGFTRFLRDRLYEALSRMEWLSFVRIRASDVTHVLTADLQRVGYATQQLLQLTGNAVLSVVHIAVALVISVPLTLFALICVAGLLLVLRPLNRQAHLLGEALRGSMSVMYAVVTEHLGGMRIAKSYDIEGRHVEKFRVTTSGVADQIVGFSRVNATARMYLEIGAAAILSIFLYGAVELMHMPAANLLVIVFLFARLLPGFSTMQQCVQRIRNALPSFRAANEMQGQFEAAAEPQAARLSRAVRLEREVRLHQVFFRYDKGQKLWTLSGVDLHIPARKVTAVVGPTGAGKSTLADLLMGLLAPDKGEMLIDGEPLTGERLHGWRQSIAYVPQENFLFHDTVRANLLWARPDAGEEDVWQALRLAAAEEFVSRLPQGLGTVVGDRGMRLSGGERQRIALARALLRSPSLLLLDEATSSLDAESERRIQEAVEQLHGELTILVIAHRLSTIRGADQIVVLDRGRVVESGTWENLTARPGTRFQSMVRMQEATHLALDMLKRISENA